MFEKILIANRGAIAARIARTCERMGIATVAIHSDIEADAAHVEACDEAVCVGSARVAESYLNMDAILEAAVKTGSQAIHPGYGLLSENAEFARRVHAAGMTFIGPSPESMELFGDKIRARALAQQAGVRVVAGSDGPLEGEEDALQQAERLGFPLMIKAAGGGGGIGMLRVDDEEQLRKGLVTCRNRAKAAFGVDTLFLEQLVEYPRHLEVQIIGDTFGECVALGERECSVQRRHQKLLEESPSPVFTGMHQGELRRSILCDAALRVAREANYHSAGTAEFLMDAQGRFFFMEFNPRLQVEHGVTEMCTGRDIVELQLLVAAGEHLPPEVGSTQPTGHAMEARIYAEDPKKNFIPKPGKIEQLRFPIVAPGSLRVESGVNQGSEMTPHYDPLVAKVIAYAPTRHQALLVLDRVLAETVIEPLTTNIDFLRRLLADESFRAGQYDTTMVERVLSEDENEPQLPS